MDTPEIQRRIVSHPLLRVLEPKILDAVIRSSRVSHFRPNRILLKEGETATAAYGLLIGSVRVYHRSKEGNEVTVKLFRAPALFGEMEVLAERPYLEHVMTLESSDLLLIPAGVLRKLVETQHRFAEALARDLAARLCIATHNERALAFDDVDTRLANLLLDYAAMTGEAIEGATRITLRVTQESMAHDLGVSRKSLVRSLGRLDQAGVVRKRAGRYEILDLPALTARSSGTLGLRYSL